VSCFNVTGGIVTTTGSCPSTSGVFNDQTTQGVIVPANTTEDLLLGGVTTSSAKFAFFNVNTGTPIASISAQKTLGAAINPALVLGSDGSVQTVRNESLTLGGNTTGNIILSPLNGIAGSAIIPSQSGNVDLGTISNQFRNLYVSGNIITAVGGQAGFFTETTSGILYPSNTTVDFLVGGNSTASSKFAVLGAAAGNPTTASVSGTTGAIYLSQPGRFRLPATRR